MSSEGADVAVIGLGPIGLLFGHVAKQRGARSLREAQKAFNIAATVSPERLKVTLTMSAD